MINIDYPFRFDSRGRTATTGTREHIRDMVEQFLFTSPGERVNRPDFGAGLLRLLFEPNSPELETALQFNIKAGLEKWVSEMIAIELLEVTSDDSMIQAVLSYVIRATGEQRVETIARTQVITP